ncbi:MAG TPA: BamA/TamA family outer membrane protein [Blastocatellia bacterium]|nr:BamA/TamA family outer membrane protein [Blastocatellia bacterium]
MSLLRVAALLTWSALLLCRFTPAAATRTDHPTTLDEAQQYRLGRLEFTGNFRTKASVLRRMIALDEGDIFNYPAFERGLERINRTGLFEPLTRNDVVITFDDAQGLAHVEVRLTERDSQRIDVSGGGGTTGGLSLGFDYTNLNLTGRADRFAARLRLGDRERSVMAGYSVSTLAGIPFGLDFSGAYRRYEFVDARTPEQDRQPLFVQRQAEASFGLTLPLSGSRYALNAPTQAGLSYSFASTNLRDSLFQSTGAPPGGGIELEQSGIRIASLTPMITHNTLDREFDPQRGRRFSAAVEVSARALGGNVNTVKPRLDFRQFIPLGRGRNEPRVLGLRARAAHVVGFGQSLQPETLSLVDGIPIFSRFFVGGESEVRGYDVNSIAPLARVERLLQIGNNSPTLIASDIRPIGGDTEVVLNTEYYVPIVRRLSAAAFLDYGAAFNARPLREERFVREITLEMSNVPASLITVLHPPGGNEAQFPRYRVSLGGELRVLVPVINLPLRLIFAFNPNAQRQSSDGVLFAPEKRFVFRVGGGRTL